jgi:uncharacterized membrane protein YfcA
VENTLLFVFLVFFGLTTQTAAGFGSTLIIVSFGVHLFPLKVVVVDAIVLSLVLSIYLLARHHRSVDLKLLMGRILPLMGLGVVLGQWLFSGLPEAPMKKALGVVVAVACLFELVRMGKKHAPPPAMGALPMAGWLFSAGVIHGLFATGGPPLVYAMGRQIPDKGQLRSTLAVVWLVLNGFLTAHFALSGQVAQEHTRILLLCLPAFVLAVVAGEWLHRRIPEKPFRVAIFVLLLAASLGLVLR